MFSAILVASIWRFNNVKSQAAHTLVELILVILIIVACAYIAVPRLQFAHVHLEQADTTARRIVTDLRRARATAILNAATNSQGFALTMTGSSPYAGYQIVDLSNANTVDSFKIDSEITCTGGNSFQFGPLGNLKDGSDTQLRVSAEGGDFAIDIVPATGAVRCIGN